jgi:uncharacterized delta-60 repeat protein
MFSSWWRKFDHVESKVSRRERRTPPRLRRATFKPSAEVLEDRTLLNAGQLDSSFGNAGLITAPVVDPSFRPYSQGMAIQADGSILVGLVGDQLGSNGSHQAGEVELFRFNPGGSLAQSPVVSTFPSLRFSGGQSSNITVEADGQVVASGSAGPYTNGYGFPAIVRYNSDLTLDTAFGGGVVFGPGAYLPGGPVGIDANGNVVFAGSPGSPIEPDMVLLRFTPQGNPDYTFGQNGTETIQVGDFQDWPTSLAFQSDNKILLAGGVAHNGVEYSALVRSDANGVLDSTFGQNGIILQQDSDADGLHQSVAVQQITGGFNIVLASVQNVFQYQTNGQPVSTSLNAATSWGSVAFQADGRIVTGAPVGGTLGIPDGFVVSRLNADGSADNTFGTGGPPTIVFGFQNYTLTPLADLNNNPASPDPAQITGGGAVQVQGDRVIVGGVAEGASGTWYVAILGYSEYPLVASYRLSSQGNTLTVTALDSQLNTIGQDTRAFDTTDPTFPAPVTSYLQTQIDETPVPGDQSPKVLHFTAGSDTTLDSLVNAASGLGPQATRVTLTVSLAPGLFHDVQAALHKNITLVISGDGQSQMIVGQSPALTVTSGTVIVTGVILTTATNSPAILVQGGSLVLRNDTIQQTSGGSAPAIVVQAGTVDLGSVPLPETPVTFAA